MKLHRSNAKRSARMAGLVVASALMAACGGGADVPPPPERADPLAAVPDNARNTVSGLVDYLGTLNRSQADGREAIDLGTMTTLPTSDDTEPAPI